jgi:beta-mannosidase
MHYSLDGQWKLSWRKLRTDDTYSDAIPCDVPGSVHSALIAAIIIDEPLYNDNFTKIGWIYENEWLHEKTFTLTKDELKRVMKLTFKGLDLSAVIYLNGHEIGRTENAFITHIYDITEHLRAGENTLSVRLDEGLYNVRDKDTSLMDYSWDNFQKYRAWMRKPQFCYGWDWTVNMATLGIWQGVYIKGFDEAEIADIYIRNRLDSTLDIRTELNIYKDSDYTLRITVTGDERYNNGEYTRIFDFPVTNGINIATLALDNPQLWWPNDLGDQHLYGITVELLHNDTPVHTKFLRYGIRTVGFEELSLGFSEDGKPARSFTFLVNGHRIFAKGACWVPCDCIPGRITAEKYKVLIDAAKDSHFNMLRVWGGGYYERDEFYDYCDENGILVWQDFMFACGFYPDFDDEFNEAIKTEAVSVVKRLRNRACLFGWSGNNENYSMYNSVLRYHPNEITELWGWKLYEDILPRICGEFDPDRMYRPSSPYGGHYLDSGSISDNSPNEGDQHTWDYSLIDGRPDFLNIWKYAECDFKFLSEYGVLAPLSVESVAKAMDEEHKHPSSDIWKKHCNNRDYIEKSVETFFGKQDKFDIWNFTLKGQAVQAEALKYGFEIFKSKRFYCSGVLLWMYTDSFGTSGWTFIDYYLNKKALSYYAKRAFVPVGVVYKGFSPNLFENRDIISTNDIEIHAVNEHKEYKHLNIVTRVYSTMGELLHEQTVEAAVPSNESLLVDKLAIKGFTNQNETVVITKVYENGLLLSQNRHFLSPIGKVRLYNAEIQASIKENKLYLKSDVFVWMAHIVIHDGVWVSDNDFDLIPNEEYVIDIKGLTMNNLCVHSLNPETKIIK